jgi:hypothetical protein
LSLPISKTTSERASPIHLKKFPGENSRSASVKWPGMGHSGHDNIPAESEQNLERGGNDTEPITSRHSRTGDRCSRFGTKERLNNLEKWRKKRLQEIGWFWVRVGDLRSSTWTQKAANALKHPFSIATGEGFNPKRGNVLIASRSEHLEVSGWRQETLIAWK